MELVRASDASRDRIPSLCGIETAGPGAALAETRETAVIAVTVTRLEGAAPVTRVTDVGMEVDRDLIATRAMAKVPTPTEIVRVETRAAIP